MVNLFPLPSATKIAKISYVKLACLIEQGIIKKYKIKTPYYFRSTDTVCLRKEYAVDINELQRLKKTKILPKEINPNYSF
ncbi:MAG: hypothetical protein R3Y26_04180 [Rikenellaceae bacterium]